MMGKHARDDEAVDGDDEDARAAAKRAKKDRKAQERREATAALEHDASNHEQSNRALDATDWQSVDLSPFQRNLLPMYTAASSSTTSSAAKQQVQAEYGKMGVRVLSYPQNNTAPCPLPLVTSLSDSRLPPCFSTYMKLLSLSTPTAVQSIGWPAMLHGFDVQCIAQTGSGKTLGFLLPVLAHLLASPATPSPFGASTAVEETPPILPRALVLAPTRELVQQIELVCRFMLRRFSIRVFAVFGGTSKTSQQASMIGGTGTAPIEILIATPGRLCDFLLSRTVHLGSVTFMVLDEADRMLAMGFASQLATIRQQVRPDAQLALFSATQAHAVKDVIEALLSSSSTYQIICERPSVAAVEGLGGLRNTTASAVAAAAAAASSAMTKGEEGEEEFDSSKEGITKEQAALVAAAARGDATVVNSMNLNIKQTVHLCAEHKKRGKLMKYLQKMVADEKNTRHHSRILVFVNKIASVMALDKFLQQNAALVYSHAVLHGSMPQAARERALHMFKCGKIPILLATDVAARGLHINSLEVVVNYDFPPTMEQYIHRIGRTGRSDHKGFAYTFFTHNRAGIAPFLVRYLQLSQQQVDPFLLECANAQTGISLPDLPPGVVITAPTTTRITKDENNDNDNNSSSSSSSSSRPKENREARRKRLQAEALGKLFPSSSATSSAVSSSPSSLSVSETAHKEVSTTMTEEHGMGEEQEREQEEQQEERELGEEEEAEEAEEVEVVPRFIIPVQSGPVKAFNPFEKPARLVWEEKERLMKDQKEAERAEREKLERQQRVEAELAKPKKSRGLLERASARFKGKIGLGKAKLDDFVVPDNCSPEEEKRLLKLRKKIEKAEAKKSMAEDDDAAILRELGLCD